MVRVLPDRLSEKSHIGLPPWPVVHAVPQGVVIGKLVIIRVGIRGRGTIHTR